MPCAFSTDVLDQVMAFHGHRCPGLTIGIRAAEYARAEFPGPDVNLTCVTETDMCGVDAIQCLTGCTYGKGNLIHRDHGKMAFSFFDRTSGRGVRLLLRPEARGGLDEELGRLMSAMQSGAATEADRQRAAQLRAELEERFMRLDLAEMFARTPLDGPAPRPARVLKSLPCEGCGEMTMESRTRRFAGQTLCIPCFAQVEQKI